MDGIKSIIQSLKCLKGFYVVKTQDTLLHTFCVDHNIGFGFFCGIEKAKIVIHFAILVLINFEK